MDDGESGGIWGIRLVDSLCAVWALLARKGGELRG